MNALLELHILQNFAPSNLNRDDTGSPKDAIFGGHRRARVSSQSFKRAMRVYFRDEAGLPPERLALRSKRLAETLTRDLAERGHDPDQAAAVVTAALGGLSLKLDDEGRSQYLLFLGRGELERLAELMHEHWDTLVAASGGETAEAGAKAKAKDAKRAARDRVPPELARALAGALDGGKALDVALFGRMLADLPGLNKDAACQVAHALSTHKVEREFDFYTAVDDLRPDDTQGADMLGTVEFTSACYYRYAVLDLEQLLINLQGDTDLLILGVEAFLKASLYAAPSGKQNSFAAHNPPSFAAFTVREQASPRNLVNAFERPAAHLRDGREVGLVNDSAAKLLAQWQALETVYGQPGQTACVNLTGADLGPLEPARVGSVAELVSRTVAHVRAALKLGA